VLRTWLRDDDGQDLIEYGLLLALVAIGLVAVSSDLAARVAAAFGDWSDAVYQLWAPNPPAS
jgi:Flp pilus assembly pilin Flp